MKYIRILSVSSWCLPLSSIRQVARAIPWSSWEGDRVGGHRKILKILAVKHGEIISSHGGLVYSGKINELFLWEIVHCHVRSSTSWVPFTSDPTAFCLKITGGKKHANLFFNGKKTWGLTYIYMYIYIYSIYYS